MNENLMNFLLSLITLVISGGGIYIIKYLNDKIGKEKIQHYASIAKTIVMSIEQLYPEFAGVDKKDLAVKKLLELTNNKINEIDADTLIEAAVYEVKKLLAK
ncbi:MAG: phage holin, LLH family [Romboutsia sp.]